SFTILIATSSYDPYWFKYFVLKTVENAPLPISSIFSNLSYGTQ
ncbi:12278_t:CDS:1, partial [Dentiscutata heterogama]